MENLKELQQDVKEIKEIVIKNTVSLDAHMRRTDLNEKRIESLERWILGLLSSALLALVVRIIVK